MNHQLTPLNSDLPTYDEIIHQEIKPKTGITASWFYWEELLDKKKH